MLIINIKQSDYKALQEGKIKSLYCGESTPSEGIYLINNDGDIKPFIVHRTPLPKGYVKTKALLVPDLEGRYIPSDTFKKTVDNMAKNNYREATSYFYRNLPGYTQTEFIKEVKTEEEKAAKLEEAYKAGYLARVYFTLKYTGEGSPKAIYSSSCYEVTYQKDMLYKNESDDTQPKPLAIPAEVNIIADSPLKVLKF